MGEEQSGVNYNQDSQKNERLLSKEEEQLQQETDKKLKRIRDYQEAIKNCSNTNNRMNSERLRNIQESQHSSENQTIHLHGPSMSKFLQNNHINSNNSFIN